MPQGCCACGTRLFGMKRLLPIIGMILWAGLGFGEVPAQREVQTRSGELELTLAVPGGEYHAGEQIRLVFTLRNIGDTMAIVRSFSPRLFDFAVYDARGVQLKAPTFFRRPILAPPFARGLQPGETLTAEVGWDLTIPDSSGHQSALSPGSYALEGYGLGDSRGRALLRTPHLPIVILPP